MVEKWTWVSISVLSPSGWKDGRYWSPQIHKRKPELEERAPLAGQGKGRQGQGPLIRPPVIPRAGCAHRPALAITLPNLSSSLLLSNSHPAPSDALPARLYFETFLCLVSLGSLERHPVPMEAGMIGLQKKLVTRGLQLRRCGFQRQGGFRMRVQKKIHGDPL